MPELPDVEGFRVRLANTLPGRTVRHVHVDDSGALHTTPRAFAAALRGRTFHTPRRHGKWLFLPTDGPALLVHSGMTGVPYYAPADAAHGRFERVRLVLDRGEFRYDDQRKLRGLWVTDGDVRRVTGELGPDALGLSADGLRDVLAGRRGRLKPTLTDQAVLAGLGNLLADEICWQSCVHPARPVRDLTDDDIAHLAAVLRRVLRTSVRHECVPRLRRWLTGRRDDERPRCPRCDTRLEHGRIGGRGTFWCPRCQGEWATAR